MINSFRVWLGRERLFLFCCSLGLLVALLAIRINLRFWSLDTVGSDTYYSWVEGDRILRGRNPYERILHGDMEENNKYSTYFPLFYEASALVQKLGIRPYHPWISFWRYFFMATNIGTGLVLFLMLFSKRTWVLSLLSMPFWFFNRWTLHSSATVALDFIPIFLMVVSLGMFDKYRKTSLLLFSFSLAIKQIAIFMMPLYLIWEYLESRSFKRSIITGLWIISIPLLSSIPFLFWNSEGFIKSVAFSATRSGLNHFGAESIDVILGLNGWAARIPFLLMLCGIYLATFRSALGRYGAAMLVMAVFIAFNSILFTHYPTWLMPLLPMAAGEMLMKMNPQV